MSLLGKIFKGVGKVVGTGLKAVSSVASLVPGLSGVGKVTGFVGGLLAPKNNTSVTQVPSPVSAGAVINTSAGIASKLFSAIRPIVGGTVKTTVLPSKIPSYSEPLTGLQQKLFPSVSNNFVETKQVDLGKGYGVTLPNFGNSSGGIDNTSTGGVPVWAWVVGGVGALLTLVLIFFGFKRKR